MTRRTSLNPRTLSAALVLILICLAEAVGQAAPPFAGTIFLDPDIITHSDPTSFSGITYAGMGFRSMFDRRVNAFVMYNAFLFNATFIDAAPVEVQVNPEFGSPEFAAVDAEKYARVVGQLPVALRTDVQTMWIHQGVQPFGGGNDNLLIHTGQADLYAADGILEEALVHEASHTSLDADHANAAGWIAAQAADSEFISTYARDNPSREDIAESFLPYLAARYRRDRISPSLAATIESTIPNRMLYFDQQAFNLSPFCTYSLVSSTSSAPSVGATGTATITAPNGCGWTASSDSAWLMITSGAGGSGNGVVGFSVAANPNSASRTATVSIGGQTFTVTQAGAACAISVNFPTSSAPSGGTSGTATVTAPGGCGWSAGSDSPWLMITSGASGSGNGVVGFTVAANTTGNSRTATVTVAGQAFGVTQAGRKNTAGSDFDGDGKADLGLFRPSTGRWFILFSNQSYATYGSYSWGNSTDLPIAGDFDGDGKADVTVYRPSSGTWFILQSSTNYQNFVSHAWGNSTDRPVAADYDGDGRTDIAVFRPSNGTWFIKLSSTSFASFASYAWGNSTDTLVVGDYDGDGRADPAVYRSSSGTWFILQSTTNYTNFLSSAWGATTDVAVPGDYDGDGKGDLGVFRPSSGTWFIKLSSTNYATYASYAWGATTDTPVAADYDGDGKYDLAVYRPSTGTWFILKSSSNYSTFDSAVWGASSDVPILRRP